MYRGATKATDPSIEFLKRQDGRLHQERHATEHWALVLKVRARIHTEAKKFCEGCGLAREQLE